MGSHSIRVWHVLWPKSFADLPRYFRQAVAVSQIYGCDMTLGFR